MKHEPEIRIVETKGEKRARFSIELEMSSREHCSPSVRPLGFDSHLFSAGSDIGNSYPIIARAVAALQAAQKPKFEVGKWYKRNFHYALKVIKISDGDIFAVYISGNEKVYEKTFNEVDKEHCEPCDPPTPNFMTADELERRFKPTGNLLEDTKLALELSIEKWERRLVWGELLEARDPNASGQTCALCHVFQSKGSHSSSPCPLRPSQTTRCGGGCCKEYFAAVVGNKFEPIIDLMKSKLTEVNEKMKAPDTLEAYGYTYKREDKSK